MLGAPGIFFALSEIIFIDKAEIGGNNWFYSMTWVGGRPPSGALSEGYDLFQVHRVAYI